MSLDANATKLAQKQQHIEESLRVIRDAVDSLRFGSIALTVHEGSIVQIDITEKHRFQATK